ncbi:hypothetical protein D9757_009067 [Collybiopsis confluens]|uniref:Uncharacterized protein n=1 Tax=Collybiopsis confluens TaxID=2823264 RepID=A0A8H5HDQ6_9AGAR|nr:hypothetical protein D9757_009067 [Collybiopsis confluens]
METRLLLSAANPLSIRSRERRSEDALSLRDMLSRLAISQDPEKMDDGPNIRRLTVRIPYSDVFVPPLALAQVVIAMVISRASVRDLEAFSLELNCRVLTLGSVEFVFHEMRTLVAPLVVDGLQVELEEIVYR